MSLDFADDQSRLAQVTAWCHQATSHYLSQCWPRFLSPYGVTGHIELTCIEPRRSHVNKVNILHAEALLMQGARALAAMTLVFIQWVEMLLTVWLLNQLVVFYIVFITHNIPGSLPKPILTKIYDATWLLQTTMMHVDIIKWKHFPHYWPFVWGIHRSPVNSPHKGQWRRALMFSFICTWINGWVNNRVASDLRCHLTHYDVTVMCKWEFGVLTPCLYKKISI